MLDPARFAIFLVSLLLITLGSRRAVCLDRDNPEAAEGESSNKSAELYPLTL